MSEIVSILGTQYEIIRHTYDDDPYFAEHSCDGYVSEWTHTIIVCDMSTHPQWHDSGPIERERYEQRIIRHEIVHAFLSESGLSDNAGQYTGPWVNNEEMVDWIAAQGPKLYAAWLEAGVN